MIDQQIRRGFVPPSSRMFWCLSFAYALSVTLIVQKSLLPLFPDIHAGFGLLTNDAIKFHYMAAEMAQKIIDSGWSEWSLYTPKSTGNVSLLAALYAILGPDPVWFIPFNAAAHATGALLIYRIGGRLFKDDAGKFGSLLAGICFLVLPSALQWYGQNHKDAFTIVGILLILKAWIDINSENYEFNRYNVVRVFGASFFGVLLLGVMRPHFVIVVALALGVSFFLVSMWKSRFSLISSRFGLVIFVILSTGFLSQVQT